MHNLDTIEQEFIHLCQKEGVGIQDKWVTNFWAALIKLRNDDFNKASIAEIKNLIRFAPVLGPSDALKNLVETRLAELIIDEAFMAYFAQNLIEIIGYHDAIRRVIQSGINDVNWLDTAQEGRFIPIKTARLSREYCGEIARTLCKTSPPVRTKRTPTKLKTDGPSGACSDCEVHFSDQLLGISKTKITKASVTTKMDRPRGDQTVFVRINGQIIGAVKNRGDNTILGLSNVQESDGRLPCVVGGVYGTSKEVIDKCIDVIESSTGEAPNFLDLPSKMYLPLRPLRMFGAAHGIRQRVDHITETLVNLRKRIEDNPDTPLKTDTSLLKAKLRP